MSSGHEIIFLVFKTTRRNISVNRDRKVDDNNTRLREL